MACSFDRKSLMGMRNYKIEMGSYKVEVVRKYLNWDFSSERTWSSLASSRL